MDNLKPPASQAAQTALRAGVFIKPSIWDVAAGVLIVREAGGSVLTWKDGQWRAFERFEPAARFEARSWERAEGHALQGHVAPLGEHDEVPGGLAEAHGGPVGRALLVER